jgi:hypothetical protein
MRILSGPPSPSPHETAGPQTLSRCRGVRRQPPSAGLAAAPRAGDLCRLCRREAHEPVTLPVPTIASVSMGLLSSGLQAGR